MYFPVHAAEAGVVHVQGVVALLRPFEQVFRDIIDEKTKHHLPYSLHVSHSLCLD